MIVDTTPGYSEEVVRINDRTYDELCARVDTNVISIDGFIEQLVTRWVAGEIIKEARI
ncbi:MAG TPA: hypothetical protein VJQ57_09385 [Acidimicrobiia bacterium]|nr:hypothetical protein [Acidimicrobiia bacterium]